MIEYKFRESKKSLKSSMETLSISPRGLAIPSPLWDLEAPGRRVLLGWLAGWLAAQGL